MAEPVPAPAPKVEKIDLRRKDPLSPKGKPKAKPAPKPAPQDGDFVTGKISDAERDVICRMLDEGHREGEIAKALGRKPRAFSSSLVGIRKAWMAARETAARDAVTDVTPASAPEPAPAPAVEPKPAPPPQPKPAPKPRASPKGQAVAFDGAVPFEERQLTVHLNALGYGDGWSAGLDRDLVEHLLAGTSLANAAILLEVPAPKVKARWKALNTKPGDLDHQTLLMRVLRQRAEAV